MDLSSVSGSYLVDALQENIKDIQQQVYFKDICAYFVANQFLTKAEAKDILKLPTVQQIDIFLNQFSKELEEKQDWKLLECLIDALADKNDNLAMKLKNSAERLGTPPFASGTQRPDSQFRTLDDNLIKLLFELEMDKYLPTFQAQEIDYKTLLQANKDDIKELIPKLGPRIKLWEKLEEIRKEKEVQRRIRVGAKRNRPHSQTM